MILFLFRDIKFRWIEYFLSSMLIALVMAALMLQRSVSSSAATHIHELAHRLGKNMLVLPQEINLADFYQGKYGSATMPAEYATQIKSSSLSTDIQSSSSILYGNIHVGDTPVVLASFDQWESTNDTVFVGSKAAKGLGLQAESPITLHGVPLKVAEVVESPPEGLDQGIFTSLFTGQQILNRPRAINALRLGGCWCQIDVETLARDVERTLPGTRAITVAAMIKAQKGSIAAIEKYSDLLSSVGIAIIMGTIALLISSQVRRQISEIGLLLAMGTSPSMVGSLFILKAGIVGAGGAFSGFLFGELLTTFVGTKVLGAPLLRLSLQALAPLIFACIILSMTAAFIPALRAARLDPAEVFRND